MLPGNTKDIKTANVVILHYITAALLFLVICILLLFSREALIGHYFHPKLLAITHITTLGWISMIIIGSLYQLAPVIANTKLYSIRLAYYTYCLILIGTTLLVVSFWHFDVGYLMQLSASILVLGVTLFLSNIYLTVQQSQEKSIEVDFISTSIFWFWLTVFLGGLLAFNFRYVFLPKEHLYFLKIHAHIGLLGWFLGLIMGVASKLVPMFLISGKLNNKLLHYSYYLLNIGLLGFTIDSIFFNGGNRSVIYIVCVLLAVYFFMLYIKEAYNKRLKKDLDIGLKHTYIAFILISIPVILWLSIKLGVVYDDKIEQQLPIALGFSILFGFISLLILGQTFKNLAFIVWLKIYHNYSGKTGTPLPKDLYSENIANAQLYSFLFGFFIVLTGILTSNEIMILIGGICVVCAGILYNINVFKIVFHKP